MATSEWFTKYISTQSRYTLFDMGITLTNGAIPVVFSGSGSASNLQIIIPFAGSSTNVSVTTPLIALQQASGLQSFEVHGFCVLNLGSVNVLYDVLLSQDGTHLEVDSDSVRTGITVPPGESLTYQVGSAPTILYYGLQANSQDHSSQPVKFAWIASPR